MISMIVAVALLAIINVLFKGLGPALLGERQFPRRVQGVLDAFPAALLAGLVIVQVLGEHWAAFEWTLLPGLVSTVIAWAFRMPQLACVAIAIAVTICVRLLI